MILEFETISFEGLLLFVLSNASLSLFLYVILGLQTNSEFSEQTPHFLVLCLCLCFFSLMGLHLYTLQILSSPQHVSFWMNIYVYEETITMEFILNPRHFQTYELIYFNNCGRQFLLDSKLHGGRGLCLDHCSVPSTWHKVVQNKCFGQLDEYFIKRELRFRLDKWLTQAGPW